MKKIFSLLLIVSISLSGISQDKKLRAGLVLGSTTNWLKIQTTKIDKDGVGFGFTIGLAADYRINNNISFSSGLQFDLESFRVNYGSDDLTSKLGNVFYGYKDTDILRYKDGFVSNSSDTSAFNLMNRKYSAKYVTIPLFLKFQTNMIGSFSYYGKFGARLGILAGSRMNDKGYTSYYDYNTGEFNRTGSEISELTNMKPDAFKKGLSFVRLGVGVYGGAEWNFTGSTFLFGELGFNYGATPVLYQKSSHLAEKLDNGSYENLDVKSNPQHMFELKIGLLF